MFFIRRVALVPNSVELLKKHGWNVRVEHDAGTGAKFRDRDYEIAGAEIVSKENVFQSGMYLHVWKNVSPSPPPPPGVESLLFLTVQIV